MTQRSRFWLVTLVCGAVLALGITLGLWQLSRAEFKKNLSLAQQEQLARPVLDHLTSDLHRRVNLSGRWVASQTLFWDNIPMSGKAGFVVLTPLQLTDRPEVVLVQRGWVQRNFVDRTALPAIESPSGVVQVQGIVSSFPSQRIALGRGESGPIRQNPSFSAIQDQLGGVRLASVSIRQTDAWSDGLLREWAPADDGVNKHLGYAFQWFSLSALVSVYYLWFQIVKRKRANF